MNIFPLDSKKIAAILLFIAPIVLLNIKYNTVVPTNWYQHAVAFSAGAIQRAYRDFSDAVQRTSSTYLNLVAINQENRTLRAENDKLKAQQIVLEELMLENGRLNKLLQFKSQTKMDLLSAQVIGKDAIVEHATLAINRGTQDGLVNGMAVIFIDGAVGYVFRPERYTSQILLLTDRYAVIDAIIQRTRARGIVEGKGLKNCRMLFLERGEDVKVGDLVVTSGLDNIFPKGFPIGHVSSVQKDPFGTTQKVDVEPLAQSGQLEEVFVVLNSRNLNLLNDPAVNSPLDVKASK